MMSFDHRTTPSPAPPLFPSLTDGVRGADQQLVAAHVASMRPGRARPGVILGVLGTIAAIVTVLLVAYLGGPWSPEEATLDFADALYERDYEDAQALVCRDQQDRFGSSLLVVGVRTRPELAGSPIWGHVEIAGDAKWDESRRVHVVPLRTTWPAKPAAADIYVVEEDGEYRVCGADFGR